MAYAWSNIRLGNDKVIKTGDKVTANDVGGKEEFEFLKSEGVIRDAKYPDYARSNESPKRAILRVRRAAVRAAEAGKFDDFADLDSKEVDGEDDGQGAGANAK